MATTVAENTNPDPTDTGKDAGAQADKSVDQLIDEYNSQFEKDTNNPPKADNEPKEDDRITQLETRLQSFESKEAQKDVDVAAGMVMDELGENVPVTKRGISAILNQIAVDNPKFGQAFQNRELDPAGWKQILKVVSKDVAAEIPGLNIDANLTSDRASVDATVRGSTKTAAEDTDGQLDMSGWSDRRFNHWKLTQIDDPKLQ